MPRSIAGLTSEAIEFAGGVSGRLPVGVAVLVIAVLSAGMWIGIYGLVSALLR